MNPVDACLTYGPLVALAVAALKRLGPLGRFVQRYPKALAFVLSGIAIVANGKGSVGDWQTFVQCVLTTYGLSVGTHETVLDPVAKSIGTPWAPTKPGP